MYRIETTEGSVRLQLAHRGSLYQYPILQCVMWMSNESSWWWLLRFAAVIYSGECVIRQRVTWTWILVYPSWMELQAQVVSSKPGQSQQRTWLHLLHTSPPISWNPCPSQRPYPPGASKLKTEHLDYNCIHIKTPRRQAGWDVADAFYHELSGFLVPKLFGSTPFLFHPSLLEKLDVKGIRECGTRGSPWPIESWSIRVTLPKSMGSDEGSDFLVIKSHSVKYITWMLRTGISSGGKSPIGRTIRSSPV